MPHSELEAALIERARAQSDTRTPEVLARRLGLSLGQVREAEKGALRKLANPDTLDPRTLDELELAELEREVLRYLYCEPAPSTPEELARRFDVPLLTVLEAQKEAMRHVHEQPRAAPEGDAA